MLSAFGQDLTSAGLEGADSSVEVEKDESKFSNDVDVRAGFEAFGNEDDLIKKVEGFWIWLKQAHQSCRSRGLGKFDDVIVYVLDDCSIKTR